MSGLCYFFVTYLATLIIPRVLGPVALNDRMIGEFFLKKDLEGNGCGAIGYHLRPFA
jgi:hypothetical protein